MAFSSRALHHLVPAMMLPLLVVPLAASDAAVRKGKGKGKPAAAARIAPRADNAIIPLPLNPIVPAAQRLCAARTPSGLGYTMLRAAPGTKPGGNDLVLVNYVGYLATTGAVFDQGMSSALSVSGVIPGFSQGLQMLGKTGIARFCIPAAMGYGAQATGPIPANADLVFQVELVDYRADAGADRMTEAPAAEPGAKTDSSPQP